MVYEQMVCPGPVRYTRVDPGVGGPPKPYKFIGFGSIHGPKLCKFIGFGSIHGPKPYKFIGSGSIHSPNLKKRYL
jgi:hypothetical protein